MSSRVVSKAGMGGRTALVAGAAASAGLVIVVIVGWRNGLRFADAGHIGMLLLREFGLLALLLAGGFGPGALAARFIGLRDRQRGEFYLFSIALGLGMLAHGMLALAGMGLLYREAAWAALGAGMLPGLGELVRFRADYQQVLARLRRPARTSWSAAALVLLLAASWLYPLLTDALVAPYSWDEVAYHLAIPKIYIQQHAAAYIPFIPYSNWPLETEMLFTLSLLLGSETLAHLISWTALLLTCWGLYLLGRRAFSRQAGVLAAAIFAATPMVGTLAGTALIELPLTLYTFLSVFAFLRWLETDQRADWMLSAVCGGLAAATKLNGALVPLILGVLMIVAALQNRPLRVARSATRFVCFGMLAFAVVAPWYAKSWVQTGNPFWPFLTSLLGGRDWDALGSDYLLGFIRQPNMPATPTNWLLGLWELTHAPDRFGPYRVALGWQYLALLPLALPVLFAADPARRRMARWLALLGLVFYTAWFFQTHQTRFLMPTAPVLALLAASGANWLWSLRGGVWPQLAQAALLLFLAATHWLASPADRARVIERWPYLSGQATRQEFLQAQIPGYATFAYANQHLPANAYVLLALYESRGYLLDRAYMWANPISQRHLRFEQFASADQLAAELRRRGFTHIIFARKQANKFRTIRYGDQIADQMLALLARHAHLIYRSSELELYELLP